MTTRKTAARKYGRRIKPSKRRTRRVDPKKLADALGADVVSSLPASLGGSQPAMLAARGELLTRLRSTGGRPGLNGATKRRQVSFTPEDWQRLEEIAEAIEISDNVKTTPSQVASALLHRLLARDG